MKTTLGKLKFIIGYLCVCTGRLNKGKNRIFQFTTAVVVK